MNVSINKAVFQKYPKLNVAFILVKDINNKKSLNQAVELLGEAEQLVKLTFNKDILKNHHLISPWLTAKEEFGKKAKHYHTSVEKLLNKVIKKKSVATKDTATNLIRYIALKHIIPIGIDDYEKLAGKLTFNIAKKKEKLTLLKKLKQGDLYYRDSKNILGTKLDYWKNQKTPPSLTTKSVLIHIEALPPIDNKKLKAIVKETTELFTSFCGGKIKVFILNKKNNSSKI